MRLGLCLLQIDCSFKLRRIRRYRLFKYIKLSGRSRIESVGEENRLQAGGSGNLDSQEGHHIFSARNRSLPGHNQPHIQLELGALSLRVRRSGREARHSLSSSIDVA